MSSLTPLLFLLVSFPPKQKQGTGAGLKPYVVEGEPQGMSVKLGRALRNPSRTIPHLWARKQLSHAPITHSLQMRASPSQVHFLSHGDRQTVSLIVQNRPPTRRANDPLDPSAQPDGSVDQGPL